MYKYSLWISGLIALVGSIAVNAIIDAIFFPLTDVPESMMTFKVSGPVGFFTFIGVVGAIIVFAIVRRFSAQPNRVFTWISIIVLLISLLPDIFIHNLGPMFDSVTPAGVVLLMAMHVACAAVTVSALTLLTKPVNA